VEEGDVAPSEGSADREQENQQEDPFFAR